MLTYVVGNLFRSPAHVLVNTVNTVGVMGKGIAKTFKQIYPEMFEQYRHHCETGDLTVGKVWLYKTPNKWVLNFPTKTTWRMPSRMEYIEKGLSAFVKGYAERGITSIAFPALGCGNGELNWEHQVRPIMEKYLRPLPIDIFIYVYRKDIGMVEHKNIKATVEWLRRVPEMLSFGEVWIDLKEVIGSGIQLESFYENHKFEVKYLRQGEGIEKEGIEIIGKNIKEHIYYEELSGLWSHLRTYFGLPSHIPASVAPFKSFLLTLFAKLPYFDEVIAAKNYKFLEAPQSRGIQYIPPSAASSSLFTGTPERLVAV
ncbi:MAG: macro domain-containing protein [bacterium]|nr:macro domain-containing protein [bacterium]